MNTIAQATLAQSQQDQNIQITLPVAITFAGIIAITYVLIKLGDRLWGKKEEAKLQSNKQEINGELVRAVATLRNHCENHKNDMGSSLQKLSEAMTKYIELQQAALKIEEYRHESTIKQMEAIKGQIVDSDRNRGTDIRELHNRLDNIVQSIGPKKS